jgi:hypothetical protein
MGAFARECHDLLAPGGWIILTVPNPLVDSILRVLKALHIVDGMALEEHYGFDPRMTQTFFNSEQWEPLVTRRFQVGLNNLLVFRRRTS